MAEATRTGFRRVLLGWRLEVADPLAGLWLEVDGQRVVPHCDGLVARITLPASIRDIVLCSDSSVPADIYGGCDERRLGLQFASLVADDGLYWRREMHCTDERLVDGFHAHEGSLRWTDGRARLPSELWDGACDMFVLRLAFAGPALPRWVPPRRFRPLRRRPRPPNGRADLKGAHLSPPLGQPPRRVTSL